jgi:LPS export ABC transporter protein LptC
VAGPRLPAGTAGRWLTLAVVVPLLAAAGCGEDPGDTETAGTAPETAADAAYPEQKFYDYRLIETEAGVKQWVLDSDEMLKWADRSDVTLVRVNMDFFREGEYFSTLVSDSGIANLQTNDVFVWGDVVVTTSDGRRLRTSELHYTNSDGLIRNEVFNVFDRGQDVITGIGLEATPDLDYIEIKRDVAAEVSDEAAAQAGGGERSREPGGSP